MLRFRGPPYSTSWNGLPSMNGSSESFQVLTFKLSPVLMKNKLQMSTCNFEFLRQTTIAFPATIPLGITMLGLIMRSLSLLLTKSWSDHLMNRPYMNIGSFLSCKHRRRGKDTWMSLKKIENNPGFQATFFQTSWILVKQSWLWHQCLFRVWPMPFCFFPKEIPGQVALESFIEWCSCLACPGRWVGRCLWQATSLSRQKSRWHPGGGRYYKTVFCYCGLSERPVTQDWHVCQGKIWLDCQHSWKTSMLCLHSLFYCLVVPAGCQTNEACSPVCNMKVHRIIAIQPSKSCHDSEDLISSPKVDNSDAASPTPLGSNTFLPPTGSVSKEDDEQQEGVTKEHGGSISPTLSWPLTKQAVETSTKISTSADRAVTRAEKGDTAQSRNGYADTARIRSRSDKDVHHKVRMKSETNNASMELPPYVNIMCLKFLRRCRTFLTHLGRASTECWTVSAKRATYRPLLPNGGIQQAFW